MVPDQWSKYEEMDRVFDHLSSRFAEAAPQLRPQGFICTVQRNQERLRVRVERGGSTVFGVNISRGGGMGDDHITWMFGRDNFSDNSFNGWATPEYDRNRPLAVLKIMDLANFGGSSDDGLTAEESFEFFWNKMVDDLDELRKSKFGDLEPKRPTNVTLQTDPESFGFFDL